MNSTQEHTSIRWETIDDQPVAHLSISADMTAEQLLEVGRRIYSTLAEMKWASATWLEVGSLGRGVRNMHLIRKSNYEQAHDATALCGRKPSRPWDIAHPLEMSVRGGICKKCRALQEHEESDGGEHAE